MPVKTVCVQVERLEGENVELLNLVETLKEDGNEVVVFATQSIVGGECVDKLLERNVKMFDKEHGGNVDMPKADETIVLDGKKEKAVDDEAMKLAKQLERAKKHGLEVTGSETVEQLEKMISDKKKETVKAAKAAAKAKAGK